MKGKVALVLYGKKRELEKCQPAWQAFKQAYVPDIFYHSWGDAYVSGVLNSSDTKAVMISQDIDFTHLHPGINQYASSAVNVLPQTYSILHADRLRTIYEDVMGFRYDWVIRSRFDLSLHAPDKIPFDLLDPNYYYVCANHWPGTGPVWDDNIMMGSSVNMAKISRELFNYAVGEINFHKVIPSGEQLLSTYIQRQPVAVFKSDFLNFTLGRNLP
jgi:hypothetical protein